MQEETDLSWAAVDVVNTFVWNSQETHRMLLHRVADVLALAEMHCPAFCFCLPFRSKRHLFVSKPFTLSLCAAAAGVTVFWGVFVGSPFRDQLGWLGHGRQLLLLRGGRGAVRKIFTL